MSDRLTFHREISTTDLSREGRHFTFAANDDECREIADFLGLGALRSLSATLEVKRWRKQGVSVEGMVHADLVQDCVVTLAPVDEAVAENISLRFELRDGRRRPARADTEQEIFVDPDAADPPELFDGPTLDLGPYLVEFLAMALNPYPRAPGAEFAQSEFPASDPASDTKGQDNMDGRADNPFHVLRHLNKGEAK